MNGCPNLATQHAKLVRFFDSSFIKEKSYDKIVNFKIKSRFRMLLTLAKLRKQLLWFSFRQLGNSSSSSLRSESTATYCKTVFDGSALTF